jgi:ligand-binding sensor domain-containing protein/signal transduction histidine kinase
MNRFAIKYFKIDCLLVIALFFLFSFDTNGQQKQFRKYSVEDGLSNNTVSSLLQDKKGYIWVGTRDGLNRFDGYNFKKFQLVANDSNSLGGDFVHAIHESNNGDLWVGTDKGLFEYHPKEETFKLIDEHLNYIRDIKENKENEIWFLSGKTFYTDMSLYKYDKKKKSIYKYPKKEHSNTTSICISPDGTLWCGQSNGYIEKYNRGDNSFTSYKIFKESENAQLQTIEKIYPISQNLILIGTSHYGLKLFNTTTGSYNDIPIYNPDQTSIFVRDILKYSEDEYWLATESGIFIWNYKTGQYTILTKDYSNPYAISDNSVYALLKDKENAVWAGTFFGGLNYYSEQNNIFSNYFPKKGLNSISGNVVRNICQDKYGNLWIGTEDAGLNKFIPKKGKFENFLPTGSQSSIAYYNINGLAVDDDELWIGFFEHGLDVMNIKTGKVVRHYIAGLDENSFKSNYITTIYKTRSGKILIGTYLGLYQYNRKNNNFDIIKHVSADAYIYTICEDHEGTVWVGTVGDGIYYFNPITKDVGNLNIKIFGKEKRIRNNVIAIFEDSNNTLWFSIEGNGVTAYFPSTKTYKNYTTQDGLPTNLVFKFLEDQQKKIWMSTSKGLACFNPTTKHFQIYNQPNGIFNSQFNYNSGYKDKDGILYFGSLSGMTSFNPINFREEKFTPDLYINSIQVNNAELTIDSNKSALKKSIIYTDKITLSHDQSSISIAFSLLSFIAPEMTQYEYKMEGFDPSWTYLKSNRRIYYTNLPTGNYVFRIKALDSKGIAVIKEKKLVIEILPPWWESKTAYGLYIFLLIGIISFVILFYHNRQNFKNKIKNYQYENAKEKELHEIKIDFFTNLAHEIRTPLTLIIGPLEKVKHLTANMPNLESSLNFMEKNTNRLLSLTNQLLDFRKLETHDIKLTLSHVNINQILSDIFSNFKSIAEQRQLSFELNLPKENIMMDIDEEILVKILNNLLSNATKYAANSIYVKLGNAEGKENAFMIEVANDGNKIPFEMREQIFKPFFRMNKTSRLNGTGIGLSISRSLAEINGGHLYLKEQPSHLNTFVLIIPNAKIEII